MTPLVGGNPTRPDLDAAELLERNEAHRLELIRARAEKWSSGLTALTGLLAAVLAGRAPQDIRAIAPPWRVVVAILLGSALAALVFSTYRAYQAAHGDLGRPAQLSRQPLTGLAERLFTARTVAAQAANTHLHHAATTALAAVILLAAATGLTWFAPSYTANPTQLCILVGGKPAAQLSATNLIVHTNTAGVTIGP